MISKDSRVVTVGGQPELERVTCPRCHATETRIAVTGRDHLHGVPGEYYVAECRACRLWYQNPRVPDVRLAELYPKDYAPHQPHSPGQHPWSRPTEVSYLYRRLGYRHLGASTEPARNEANGRLDRSLRRRAAIELIPEYVEHGTLLELGCATGERLCFLRHLGWRSVRGIELVESAAEMARRSGFDVDRGLVDVVLGAYPAASVDVVVSSMVLEHLPDPFRVITAVADTLTPGGEFLFSTVVRDSLDGWLYGPYWSGFDLPRHLVYFTKRDVQQMLAGRFAIVEMHHHVAPIDFVRPSTWRRAERRLIDRFVLAITARPRLASIAARVLARLGLTSRVSFRCRKRTADVSSPW